MELGCRILGYLRSNSSEITGTNKDDQYTFS